MTEYLLAAIAGVATILSPCILPLLPIVLATSAGRPKAEPALIVAGFVLSFAFVGVLLSVLSASSGELQDGIRTTSLLLLLTAGLACFWSTPFDRLVGWASAWRGSHKGLRPPRAPHGFVGTLLVGASLGIAWTPCAGPVLAAALALAASAEAPGKSGVLLGVYAAGAGVPLLTIAYSGDWVASRMRFFQKRTGLFRKTFGVIAMAVALLQLLHYDVAFNAWATQWLPSISTGL